MTGSARQHERTIVGLGMPERVAATTSDTWGELDGALLAPHTVEIQPTAHCHRTCSFCSHIIRNRRGGILPEAEVRQVLTELRDLGTKHIGFSGGGEPLNWAGGRVADMIELVAEFATVSLTSSGDQLWDGERRQLHPDADVVLRNCTTTYFNIPAVDERSWRKQVRGPSGWPHTSAMLRALVAERDRSGSRCEIHAVVVISAFNLDQIAEIDKVLIDHGADAIYYKQWKNFEKRNVKRVRLEDEHIVERLTAIPEAERSRDLTAFIAKLGQTLPNQPCWANRLGYDAVLDPDGEVYLCGPTVGKHEMSIGNLDDGGFTALWTAALRTARMRELSDMSSAGVCPTECSRHSFNVQVDAGLAVR